MKDILERVIDSVEFNESMPPDNPGASDTDWKEFLRLYEEWVDDYIALLEKMSENPDDLSILTDYLEALEKMAEWAEMAENLEDDLTGDDLKEYMEVMTRILQKLSAVA